MLRRLQVFGDDTGTIGFEKHAKPVIDLVLEHPGVDDMNGHHLVSEEIISTMGELIRRIAGNGIVLSDQKVEAKILDIMEKEMKNTQAVQQHDALLQALQALLKQIGSSERVDSDDTAATGAVEGMIRAAQSPFLCLLLHWQTLR